MTWLILARVKAIANTELVGLTIAPGRILGKKDARAVGHDEGISELFSLGKN